MKAKLTKFIYNTSRYALFGMLLLCSLFSFAFADDSKAPKMSIEEINVVVELNDISVEQPQTHVVSGIVTDQDGEPLPGASIIEKGTVNGAQSGFDGSFSLVVTDANATLVVSFIGFLSQEIAVAGQEKLTIALVEDAANLDEVVVTGYGTKYKKDIIGSVAVVDVASLKSIPAGSAAQALQGQVSGVNVVNSGLPGAAPSINIRGISSFGDSQPLVLIDGIQGNLNDISASDVESMQVLKDAGAAAIYGVRGANGVIIVTTKRGKAGIKSGPTFTYDANYGVQMPLSGNPFDIIIDPVEFARLALIADPANGLFKDGIKDFGYTGPNGGGIANAGDPAVDPSLYNPGVYIIQEFNKSGTNWFQEAFSNAPTTEHNMSISDATEKANYMVSLGYLDQQGTYVGTYAKRYSLRINTEFKLRDNIRIGQHLNIYYKDNQGGTANDQFGGGISELYKMMPIVPTHDIGGNYGGSRAGINLGSMSNSIASQERKANNLNETTNLIGDVYAEVDFLKNFTIRSSIGGTFTDGYNYSHGFTPSENAQGNQAANSFSESSSISRRIMFTNTLKYNNQFGEHDINVLLGSESIKTIGRSVGGSRESYFTQDPNYVTLSTGTENITNFSNAFENTLFSLFGRLDYSYNDKYLLGVTVRRDGSSRFGEESRYGTFPSASIGWRLSNEGFMQNITWLNDLKLRGSYGVLGSQNNVNPVNQYDLFGGGLNNAYYDITGSLNSVQQGFFQIQNGNAETGWEKNIVTNAGFDATLFNKLNISLEFYKKTIEGLLFPKTLPATAGGAAPATVNIGDIQNSGFDFSTSYYGNINDDLEFSVGANITSYDNTVKSIPDPGYFDTGRHQQLGDMVRNMEGEAVSSFFGYDVIDLFDSAEDVTNSPTQDGAAPGRFKYRDVNGDDVINSDDRAIIGNPNPDFTYGLTLSLNYKGFDFSTMLHGSQGNEAINTVRTYTDFFGTYVGAKGNRLLNAWTPENKDTSIPIIENATSFSTAQVLSSYFVEDASYLRMKSLILGYTFNPDVVQKLGLGKLRVYVQGTNLFTITNYTGLNPETTGSSSSFGIDYAIYPTNQQTFLLGLNLTF